MANMKQYPHYLWKFVTPDGDAVQNEDGNFVSPDPSWILHGRCREETNGKGSVITLADGRQITFGALIQSPKGTAKIPEGTKIRVTNDPDGSDVRVSWECLKGDVGQLHTRHWM